MFCDGWATLFSYLQNKQIRWYNFYTADVCLLVAHHDQQLWSVWEELATNETRYNK